MHLELDRLLDDADPPRTASEDAHLAACGQCQVEAAGLMLHMQAPPPPELPDEPGSGPATRCEDEGERDPWDLEGSDALLAEHADLPVPPGADRRRREIGALDPAGVVPWFLRGPGVSSQLLPGEALGAWLAGGGAQDRSALLRILEDVGATLQELHERGHVHGSVRQSRVLVSRGRGFLLLAGLEATAADAEVSAFQRLCAETLAPDLAVRLAEVPPALSAILRFLHCAGLELARVSPPDLGELRPGLCVGGRFEVRGTLGFGGTAVVYEVEHRQLGTRHALKVPHPTRAGAGRAGRTRQLRLLREGRLLARLDHPNVLPVSDLVDVHGRPALIMPRVDGPCLADALLVATPSVRDALDLFCGIVEGVRYAHRHGVVHRDLKPSNVLLERLEGGLRPRVADFGFAKAMDRSAEPRLTETDTALGTLCYAAPEQLVDAASVDARADLWALACVLHELVAGDLPPSPGSASLCGLPAAVEPLVRGLLRPAPGDRMPLDEVARHLAHVGARPVCAGPFARAVLTRR